MYIEPIPLDYELIDDDELDLFMASIGTPTDNQKPEWSIDAAYWAKAHSGKRLITLKGWCGRDEINKMYLKYVAKRDKEPKKRRPPRDRTARPRTEEALPIETTFEYNPITGIVRRRGVPMHVILVTKKGYGYVRYGIKSIAVAHLAWFLVRGEWPNGRIKWINGDRRDNRIENLRVGYNPVKRYQAQVMRNGVRVSLGYFDSPLERDMVAMNYRLGLTP